MQVHGIPATYDVLTNHHREWPSAARRRAGGRNLLPLSFKALPRARVVSTDGGGESRQEPTGVARLS